MRLKYFLACAFIFLFYNSNSWANKAHNKPESWRSYISDNRRITFSLPGEAYKIKPLLDEEQKRVSLTKYISESNDVVYQVISASLDLPNKKYSKDIIDKLNKLFASKAKDLFLQKMDMDLSQCVFDAVTLNGEPCDIDNKSEMYRVKVKLINSFPNYYMLLTFNDYLSKQEPNNKKFFGSFKVCNKLCDKKLNTIDIVKNKSSYNGTFDRYLHAVKSGNILEINRYIKKGIDINARDGLALYSSVKSNNSKLEKFLIAHGAKVNQVVMKRNHESDLFRMNIIHQTLDMFRLDYARFPTQEEGLQSLVPKYLSKKEYLLNVWGYEYHYQFQKKERPILTSYGADNKPGGEGYREDISLKQVTY